MRSPIGCLALVLVLAGYPAMVACSSKPSPPPCNVVAQPWMPSSGAIAGQGSASASTSPAGSVESAARKPEFTLEQLLQVQRATSPRAISEDHFLYLSDPSGTMQIFEHAPSATSATTANAANAVGSPSSSDPSTHEQRTSFPDRISSFRVSPDGKSAVFLKDQGGDENDQIHRLSLDLSLGGIVGAKEPVKVGDTVLTGSFSIALTHAPKVKHTLPMFDDAGEHIAYTSNARNGKDMDLYVDAFSKNAFADVTTVNGKGGKGGKGFKDATEGKAAKDSKVEGASGDAAKKPLVELTGSFTVADFRGNRALLVEERSSFDQDLWIIDVKSKSKKLLTKHVGEERWEAPKFSRDGKVVFALGDAGREYMTITAIDVASLARTNVVELDHDITALSTPRFSGPRAKAKATVKKGSTSKIGGAKGEVASDAVGVLDGNAAAERDAELRAKTEDLLLYKVNIDGVEQIDVVRLDDKRKPLANAAKSELRGVISSLDCDPTGKVAFLSLERAELPPEIYRVDLMTMQATRQTHSDHGAVDEAKLVPAELLSYKTFDGKSISYFWYAKPAAAGEKRPVVIQIHGGPEAQAQPYFSAVTQYLALAGYAVAVPNVRGSIGYGKAFAHLDDKDKREDSVRDLSELGKVLAQRADVDAKKLVLFGGSYGGYMVLAGMTLYPEQWAAGVDIVGIANFRTFLEQTAPYRRALREAEYGSLEKDGALLDKISPIHRVDKITAPLMVIHGMRDPRVPIGEAVQIAAALKKRGLPVELLTFDDEGHGLAKLKNKLVAYPAMIAFLDKYVRDK